MHLKGRTASSELAHDADAPLLSWGMAASLGSPLARGGHCVQPASLTTEGHGSGTPSRDEERREGGARAGGARSIAPGGTAGAQLSPHPTNLGGPQTPMDGMCSRRAFYARLLRCQPSLRTPTQPALRAAPRHALHAGVEKSGREAQGTCSMLALHALARHTVTGHGGGATHRPARAPGVPRPLRACELKRASVARDVRRARATEGQHRSCMMHLKGHSEF